MGIEKSICLKKGRATIVSWFDEALQKTLFQVRVDDVDGGISLPSRISDGTREKVEKIFAAISPQDDHSTIFQRYDELDKL